MPKELSDSDPRNMIGSTLTEQFKKMSIQDLNEVYKIAYYVKLRPLCRSISIFMACLLRKPLNLKTFK